MAKRKKSKRVCLRCDGEFMSDGIYNRICPGCKNSNATIAMPDREIDDILDLYLGGDNLRKPRHVNKKITDE